MCRVKKSQDMVKSTSSEKNELKSLNNRNEIHKSNLNTTNEHSHIKSINAFNSQVLTH